MSVCIIGGGIIGLYVAVHLQKLGHIVTIFNSPKIPAASHYAGGMLAPFSEAWVGEEKALEWGQISLQLWKDLFHTLGETYLFDHGIITAKSSLLVAGDRADKAHIVRVHKWLTLHGHLSTIVNSQQLQEYGGFSSYLSGGLAIPEEYTLDNRKIIGLLHNIFIQNGGVWNAQEWDNTMRTEKRLYIFAQGISTVRQFNFLDIRGVQGEIIRLERPNWAIDIPKSTIRGVISGRNIYIIPRDNGVVIGATEYEANDRKPQLGGVLDLLSDAIKIIPGLRDYLIIEISSCVRPVRSDALPWVGKIDQNTIVAAGHGRNGFLLAPLTAYVIGEIIDDTLLGRRNLVDLSVMQ